MKMMSLHERRCYSFNDIGILVEEELQELGVVTDVVKQPSSVVELENRTDVRSTPIRNTRSSSSPRLLE